MISLRKINRQQVRAIPLPENDNRPVKGGDIIANAYANVFLCAKKHSGKTSVIFHLLKECTGKNTNIIAFCSTLYKDSNWIQIRKWLEKKGNNFVGYTSLFEDGVDRLEELINDLNSQAQEDKEEDEEGDQCDDIFEKLKQQHNDLSTHIEKPEREKKPKREKYLAPEHIIVLDDLSNELKSPSLVRLLKMNRHYKLKIFCANQYLNDMLPAARKQLDVVILFKSFPLEKLKEIYKDMDLALPFETFVKIYSNATNKPYSFLYIDVRRDEYRKNFDHQYIIPNDTQK